MKRIGRLLLGAALLLPAAAPVRGGETNQGERAGSGEARLGDWKITTVDRPCHSTGERSLALDAHGHPHLCYYDWEDNSLKHARGEPGSGWTIELVDPEGCLSASLALDSTGRCHLGYGDWNSGLVKYAYQSSESDGWSIEIIDSGSVYSVSLALDSSGNPSLAYQKGGTVTCARKEGGNWIIEAVAEGSHPALAVDDASGDLHISYLNKGLYHAWKNPEREGWNVESVDPGAGQFDSIAVSGGLVHIAYDGDLGSLKYARRTAGGWAIEPVPVTGPVHGFVSIAADREGLPRISYSLYLPIPGNYYSSGEPTAVQCAAKTRGGWLIQTVEKFQNELEGTAIAVDAGGKPQVSYCQPYPGQRLRHARWVR